MVALGTDIQPCTLSYIAKVILVFVNFVYSLQFLSMVFKGVKG